MAKRTDWIASAAVPLNESTKAKPYPETPELDKMGKISIYSNVIGEFLDWLRHDQKVELCKWHDATGRLRDGDFNPEGFYPDRRSIEQLLADYYKIDLKKVEEERRAILEAIR